MTDGELTAEAEPWNLSPVLQFLTARTDGDATAAWADALPAISEGFPPELWVADHAINTFGHGAHRNLYEVEGQRDFRDWLQSSGVSIDDYSTAVGPVQYVSIQLHLLSLMPRARSNRGWRVRIIGFPPLGVVACGLASHYQGTQNHNQMGRASALIRSRALEVLTGDERGLLESWPAATANDWEERGLMSTPVTTIGDLDIASFDEGKGAKLRMVRNTTVKKELATFFAIRGMTTDEFLQNGSDYLDALRDIALGLGKAEGS